MKDEITKQLSYIKDWNAQFVIPIPELSFMHNEKVLVTGATGFIGNYVIEELLKHNLEIIATSSNEEKAKQLFGLIM